MKKYRLVPEFLDIVEAESENGSWFLVFSCFEYLKV